MKRCLLIASIILLAPWTRLHAGSRALIVTGLSGSSDNHEEFSKLAADTKRLLIARGFPVGQVEVLNTNVTRDMVLQHLQPAKTGAASDEFWLVLYGHSGVSQGGEPAFQVRGPRLAAGELKTALDAMPGRQFVLIGTNSSGAFLPILQSDRRTVVSATKEEGQYDQPRFPEKWVAALEENPKATFAWLAARAAALVDEEYKKSGLVQTESARMADPVSGSILEPPFGQDMTAAAETPPPADNNYLINASEIREVKIHDPNAEWEEQPATDETREIIREAKAVPNPDDYPAIVLDQQLHFTVEEDRTTDEVRFHRVYIAHEEAVEEWANYFLPQNPPEVTTRLQVARIIRPDGTSLVFNPEKLDAGADPASGAAPGSAQVFLPGAHSGCVVEIGYRTRQLLDASLPHVSEAIPIQREAPVVRSEMEVRVPAKELYHVALKNSVQPATETMEEDRHVYRWKLGPLAAAEALPGDAPAPEWQVWLGISSLPSWDEFATWYNRISKNSDIIDDSVKKEAADLGQGAKTRMEKLQRAFEFVSSLRYIAIELGVQDFRPRTPAEVLSNRYGDCKDKANLLRALLRCMGVDARFVLLDRGGSTDVSFPSWQFNHAICFVPKAPETGQATDLWLDSTDSVTPFGFIAPGDYGREALVFDKEKADFKKIAGTGEDVSRIADDWDLTEDGSGTWSGTFSRRTDGLADYGVRAAFRGLSPGQRKYLIYEKLDGLLPTGVLTDATISDVSELHHPMELHARASSAAHNLPRADFEWLEAFCDPQRDRPLLLNDGQQFAGVQTVKLHFAKKAPRLPDPVEIEAAGQSFQITWQKLDARTAERVAEVTFKNPTIAAADYAGLRRSVEEWKAALERSDF